MNDILGDFHELWADIKRWFGRRRRQPLTWLQVDAFIVDAFDEVFQNWTIGPSDSDPFTELVVGRLREAGIEVTDDRPTGPTVRQMFEDAGLPTSNWPGMDQGIKPW